MDGLAGRRRSRGEVAIRRQYGRIPRMGTRISRGASVTSWRGVHPVAVPVVTARLCRDEQPPVPGVPSVDRQRVGVGQRRER